MLNPNPWGVVGFSIDDGALSNNINPGDDGVSRLSNVIVSDSF
jgi:hypothetical protein